MSGRIGHSPEPSRVPEVEPGPMQPPAHPGTWLRTDRAAWVARRRAELLYGDEEWDRSDLARMVAELEWVRDHGGVYR